MTGRHVPLSSSLGELMAPQTLITALIITPDGRISVEPGALHGRSAIESQVQMVAKRDQIVGGRPHWIVWVAVELDPANAPVRYAGVSVAELLVDAQRRTGYKSVAQQVNRISEALRGAVNVGLLDAGQRTLVKDQLMAIGSSVWQSSPEPLRQALESA